MCQHKLIFGEQHVAKQRLVECFKKTVMVKIHNAANK